MRSALIIGSGPAAAGVALALSRAGVVDISVIDIGLDLERETASRVREVSAITPDQWPPNVVTSIAAPPVTSAVKGLPQKRVFGSDYPYRDVGQLAGIVADRVNGAIVSPAYGGFSTVWGAQVMPFTAATFSTWPITAAQMQPHYEAILRHIPFAGHDDDLADLFPLFVPPKPLPELSERSARAMVAYERRRSAIAPLGVTLGRARLALESSGCVRCGLCMTGCPYSLIYSSSSTFDELRRRGTLRYLHGLLAVEVSESATHAYVDARELRSGQYHHFTADRVFVACGAIGTTRLMLGSLKLFDRDVMMQESAQFVLPFVSRAATKDPRHEPSFTLNQFNMVVRVDGSARDVSQLHFYSYNPAFVDNLPTVFRSRVATGFVSRFVTRASVALGYLPSWASPALRLRVGPPLSGDDAAPLQIKREPAHWSRNRMLRKVLTAVTRAAPSLDLWPVLPKLALSGGAKSYHFGGSFPHSEGSSDPVSTDRLGRPAGRRRLHLVDASVFPDVPATTFTLTIMANAHRIASESLAVVE